MAEERPFQEVRITDVCVLVEDLDRAMNFYRDLVGFRLRRHAPGFADFVTDGVTLALWERRHLAEHVGIDKAAGSGSMSAVEMESPGRVEAVHMELSGRGVSFLKPPKWYAWNAYACYFEDPDGHLWEIYAWGIEGHAGLIPLEERGRFK
jgi:catechol 2,3-dioxygenase-like lactoylglutathione lyase family enzyme